MGILDELKQQAEKQQETITAVSEARPGAEEFYREHVKARMLTAFNFLTELVNQLIALKLETRVQYPLKPEGKPLTLQQKDYKVYSDDITDPRQVTLSFNCGLVNPATFEITGRAAVLAQSEILDRYTFKYKRVDKTDPRQIIIGAVFNLIGPLPMKLVMQFDDSKQIIKLLLTNFVGPGTSQYNLTPEKLDEAFLDHLGKYILRKEPDLFKEEISEEAKKKLRERMMVEAQIREQEMIESEERRRVEEAAVKERTAKEQIKRAVNSQTEQLKRVMNTQVAKGKESLKGMFDKLKKQVQAPQQTSPAQSITQTAPPASIPPTKPAQANQQLTAKTVISAQTNTRATVTPPVISDATTQVREPAAAPAKTQLPQTVAAEVPTQSTSALPVSTNAASQPAVADNSNTASSPSPLAVPTATVKKTQPPKVYNAPPNNPFLKPEPPVEPPVDAVEQEAKTPAEKPEVEATPVADSSPRLELTPESLEKDLARFVEGDKQNMPQQTSDSKKTIDPFLQTSSTMVAAQTATAPAAIERPRPYLNPGELNTSLSDVLPITRQAVNAKDTTAPQAKNSTQNPFLNPDELELDIDISGDVVPPQNNDSKVNS